MRNPQDLALRQTFEALVIDYWHEVDMCDGADAPSYDTDDAVFKTSAKEYHGRAALQQYYGSRDATRAPTFRDNTPTLG